MNRNPDKSAGFRDQILTTSSIGIDSYVLATHSIFVDDMAGYADVDGMGWLCLVAQPDFQLVSCCVVCI